jgi:hypothetical protein
MRSPEEVERDIEDFARVTAIAATSCDELIDSGRLPAYYNDHLRKIRDAMIEAAAMFARSDRSSAHVDAVLFGTPDLLEAAIRDRLTPGQLAQLAARLTS